MVNVWILSVETNIEVEVCNIKKPTVIYLSYLSWIFHPWPGGMGRRTFQPKQTCFRASHHHWAVNRAELSPSIFIRLQNPLSADIPWLCIALSKHWLSGLEQPEVIWQEPGFELADEKLALRHDFKLICCADPSRHMFASARSDDTSLWKYMGCSIKRAVNEPVVPEPSDSWEWSRGQLPAYQGEGVKLLWNIRTESDQRVN